MRRALLLLICAAAWPPLVARAQEGPASDCTIVDADFLQALDQGTRAERVILRGEAHVACGGGVTVRADSMVSHTVSGRREFIGNVLFEDSIKSLVADRVDYDHVLEKLVARGNVVLTDLERGSVIERGTELEYFRETDSRPEARTIVRGRPHATLYDSRPPSTSDPAADPASGAGQPADSTASPLEIDADEMVIVGERLFRAIGRVEFVRGETHGSAREADFDQLDERILLTGEAMVEGESFTLTGERINAYLEGDTLREVRALENAILLSEELRVDAPELLVLFREGEVHRMVAMRLPGEDVVGESAEGSAADAAPADSTASAPAETAPSGPPRTVGPQPRAMATDFWLTADSIDALAPGQRLETVVAVGDAYGERTADSLSAVLPGLIARDWLRGDTITGYFAVTEVTDSAAVGADSAAVDSGETSVAEDGSGGDEAGVAGRVRTQQTTLERLVAVGPDGTAQSLYRIREKGAEAEPSVNYLTASRIVLFLRNGEVASVEADGPVQGYHLQPAGSKDRRPEGADVGDGPPDPEQP